jgi:ATP-binding cassette, subfamily F, member 3
MLAISDASFGYHTDEGIKTIVCGVSKSVLAGQRIGILGANGQGKSTVVKTIARDLNILSGTVTEGKGLRIGYFAQQELDVLRAQDTPLEHMIRLAKEHAAAGFAGESGKEQDLRGFLGAFNFGGDMVKQAVGTMSGGEKARLVLCMMVWQRPNLLLLDEPTNHLDLTTREALAMALNEFEGTVMLVSHDRALLRSVCDEFWLVGRGVVAPFDGDLDDYQRYLLDESKRLREEAKVERAEQAPAAAAPVAPPPAALVTTKTGAARAPSTGGSSQSIKKKLLQTETLVAQLQAEQSVLHTKLSQTPPPADLAVAAKRLNVVDVELAQAEEQWMVLSEELEAHAS